MKIVCNSFLLFLFITLSQASKVFAGSSFSSLSSQGRAYLCVKWGDENCVRNFLDKGMDPNSSAGCGLTWLHLAAGYGRDHIVTLLLEYGADINRRATGESSFFESCDFNPKRHKGWSAATFAKFAETLDDLHIAYLRRPVTWRIITECPAFDFESEIQLAKKHNGQEYIELLNQAREQMISDADSILR